MLLMHGPAPSKYQQSAIPQTLQERGWTPPLASSSPVLRERPTPSQGMTQSTVELFQQPPTIKRAYRPLKVVTGTKYPVAVSHWHSLSSFFVQLGNYSELLNELTQLLIKAFELNYSKQRTVLSQSPLCMAKWDDDEMWYRAEMLDKEAMMVLFVDYGNVAIVRRPEALHDMPNVVETHILFETEALAIRCSLAGLRMHPQVVEDNLLVHEDGQSLADWFKTAASTCDAIFTGNVFEDIHEVHLIQRADGRSLSEQVADRYPHAFELVEGAVSSPQSPIVLECDAVESSSLSEAPTESTTVDESDQLPSSAPDSEKMTAENSVIWQFDCEDFIDAKVTFLDPKKLDLAYVQLEHLAEKQISVNVACCQESSAPPLHKSALIPGATLIFQDPHDKNWYRAILEKKTEPKTQENEEGDVQLELFLMDVGRFERCGPSMVRGMPACVAHIAPLASCVQVRRRPDRLAVNEPVILVLVSLDTVPLVDLFANFDDYEAAQNLVGLSNRPSVASKEKSSLLQKQRHLRYDLTDVPSQSNSPPATVFGAGRAADIREFPNKRSQPSLISRPNEAPVVAKIAHMQVVHEAPIIQPAPSAIHAAQIEANRPTTAAPKSNSDMASSTGGADSESAAVWVPMNLLSSDSLRNANSNCTAMNGASNPRTLKVPQLALSNGDSVLVHLEIDSLMNDPLNFFMTKDCGSEFPLMLDEMNSRSQEKTPMADVKAGDHCLLVDESGRVAQFHRVEVVETDGAKRTATVLRLDHGGTFDNVRIDELFELVVDEVRLPRIAIRSRLNADYYDLKEWNMQVVRACLRQFAKMRNWRHHLLLRAHVSAYKDGVATVRLSTRDDSSADVISEALCSARQARISAQSSAANASPEKTAPKNL